MITIDLTEGKKLVPQIVLVGAGGTGGYILQHVAQMMDIFGLNGSLLVSDPDVIETKNLGNQLFVRSDVGKPKAEVLARRYRTAYSVQISHHVNGYVESVEQLRALFDTKAHLLMKQHKEEYVHLPILIGAVDNHFTRKIFHQFFCESTNLLYIDVGNTATSVPNDWKERDKSEWTVDELETYKSSGYNGQVVCGLKQDGEVVLEPVAHFFPEILTSDDEIAPSQLSCSQLAKSEPQRVITNKFAALAVSSYINELFDEGTLSNHLTLFHAKKSFMKAVPIKE